MTLVWGWYGQLWPNLVASGICTLFGFVVAHRRLKKHVDRHMGAVHEKLDNLHDHR